LFILLVFAVVLAGCSPAITIRPSAPDDLDKIKSGQLAAVLLQIKINIDGKSVSPTDAGDPNNSPRIYLASLGDPKGPKRVLAASPSETAAVEGWLHMLLPPGTYYLLVLPPGMEQNPPAVAFHIPSARFGRLSQYKFEPGRGGFWSPELMGFVFTGTPPQGFHEIPGFWFQVPEGKPIVYIGSLSTACTGGRGLFGSLIDSCSDYDLTLDQKAAMSVAAVALPGAETVEIDPMTLYGKARDALHLRDRGAITVAISASKTLDAVYTGALMAPWGTIHGTGRAVSVYNLLAIIGEASTRAGAQQQAEQRALEAQSCMKRLSEALQAMEYAAPFSSALTESALSHGTVLDLDGKSTSSKTGQSGRAPLRLRISIPILQMRDSAEAQYLSLELGLHVRLETVDTGRAVYDGFLLYAEGFPAQNPLAQRSRLYERLVPERAQPRLMSQWCGANGETLLREEVGKGMKHIAAQLARDLE
jgi:hypothetical protein